MIFTLRTAFGLWPHHPEHLQSHLILEGKQGQNWLVLKLNYFWCIPEIWRLSLNPWIEKILWRRKWQSTPVFLPGEFHGQGILVGYSPWSCKVLDTTEQLTHMSLYHVFICIFLSVSIDYLFISSLINWLFNSILFSFHVFAFCIFFFSLEFISNFIAFWLEKMLDMMSIFLNLPRLIMCSNMSSILKKVPCALEKNVYSVAFRWKCSVKIN